MTPPHTSSSSRRDVLAFLMIFAAPGMAASEAVPVDTFGLSSMFVAPDNKCLDANPGGYAIQTGCDYNEAQYWRALPAADDSYFRLTTEATPGLCLQALRGADGVSSGASMVPCAEEPGQKWIFTDSGVEHHYRLHNTAGGAEACLEGNRVGPGAFLDGAAFLDRCSAASGQLWLVTGAVPVNGIPVPLDALPD